MDEYEIIASAEVKDWPLVYVLGSCDSRITFFSQQVRGFNLAYALSKAGRLPASARIAVIGAGAAGLSVSAGLVALLPKAKVHIFEREQAILHLQRACSKRNLHPHIYDWPKTGASDAYADLPLLDWFAGTAKEVARQVERKFRALAANHDGRIQVHELTTVTGIVPLAKACLLSYRRDESLEIDQDVYHAVILAIGFGAERGLPGSNPFSYWSDRGMPDGPYYQSAAVTYLVSGSGDGALIDLCAAALQDFDHTELIEKVVEWPEIESLESRLLAIEQEGLHAGSGFDFMAAYEGACGSNPVCVSLIKDLARHVRKRTTVIFNTACPYPLEQPTSILNRFLVFLLFRARQLAGVPIDHIVGVLSADHHNPGWYDIGGRRVQAHALFARHGADKEAAFAPFALIFEKYQADHAAWLAGSPQRSVPPHLSPKWMSLVTHGIADAIVPVTVADVAAVVAEQGWQGYAAWSAPAEGLDAAYIPDDGLRVYFEGMPDGALSVLEAIETLRARLSQPRTVIRLVGLSGVGKTRLLQALFDARVGRGALSGDLVVYTDLSADPAPPPQAKATQIALRGQPAILVVDNCGYKLHRELASECQRAGSQLSVVTVEYDVRDDKPEGTQVVRLEPSSDALITQLLMLRFSTLSQPDVLRLADLSGGNARVAISLASVAVKSGNLAALSDEVLFERLFDQGHGKDKRLLRAAQVCSLLYSFDAEFVPDGGGELARLAELAQQPIAELYSNVSELERRQLAQRRSTWVAVLPHAFANRLAMRALEDTPPSLIEQQLVFGASERVLQSFCRRLSYLQKVPAATRLVERWTTEGGHLGDFASLTVFQERLVASLAPLAPGSILAALERMSRLSPDTEITTLAKHVQLLVWIAYEVEWFDRCIALLKKVALGWHDQSDADAAEKAIAAFCRALAPGTHASAESRLQLVELLVLSSDADERRLGLLALRSAMSSSAPRIVVHHEFGAAIRDGGVMRITVSELINWYRRCLHLMQQYTLQFDASSVAARNILAGALRGFCAYDELVPVICDQMRMAANGEFWFDGWTACRQVLYFDSTNMVGATIDLLQALKKQLAPVDLVSRVRASLQGSGTGYLDSKAEDGHAQRRAINFDLGRALAGDRRSLAMVFTELMRGGDGVEAIGAGLAAYENQGADLWPVLVEQWEHVPEDKRSPTLLAGFLGEVGRNDSVGAERLLDEGLTRASVLVVLPALQAALGFNSGSVERMVAAFADDAMPLKQYGVLHGIFSNDPVVGVALAPMIMNICDTRQGFAFALDVVMAWLTFGFHHEPPASEVIATICRQVLRQASLVWADPNDDYALSRIARLCLCREDAGDLAAELAINMRDAVSKRRLQPWDLPELKTELLSLQPIEALNAWYSGSDEDRFAALRLLSDSLVHTMPVDQRLDTGELLAWCGQGSYDRFLFAASFVTLVGDAGHGAKVFTELAIALLKATTDPVLLFAIYVQRFRPNGWSGSLAVILESNAAALDTLPVDLASQLAGEVKQAKQQLLVEAAERRREEARRDRLRDERFE